MPPRASTADDLGLVEPDHRFGEGIDAPICQDCRGGTLGGIEVCCAQPVIIDEGVVELSSDESLKPGFPIWL